MIFTISIQIVHFGLLDAVGAQAECHFAFYILRFIRQHFRNFLHGGFSTVDLSGDKENSSPASEKFIVQFQVRFKKQYRCADHATRFEVGDRGTQFCLADEGVIAQESGVLDHRWMGGRKAPWGTSPIRGKTRVQDSVMRPRAKLISRHFTVSRKCIAARLECLLEE